MSARGKRSKLDWAFSTQCMSQVSEVKILTTDSLNGSDGSLSLAPSPANISDRKSSGKP